MPSSETSATKKGDKATSLASRRLAVQVLSDIFQKNLTFDESLSRQLRQERELALDARDMSFVRKLVTSALRRSGEIRYLLTEFMSKGIPPQSDPLKEILQIGTAQLLFLETPPHAAIHSSVELAKQHKKTQRFASLVNAVLRKISAHGNEKLGELEEPLRLNTPAWMRKRWEKAYGTEVVQAMMACHQREPALDLTVQGDAIEWAKKLNGIALFGQTVRLENHKGKINEIAGFAEGNWWVQDLSASQAVLLAGDIEDLEVADLCAAPGGKTAQLLAKGARVTAVDQSERRLEKLQGNLDRLGMAADIECSTIEAWQPDKRFDLILLDAPCSATGTIRRHPELPYLRKKEDIARLAETQREMFLAASKHLKASGRLIYCTCSLEPEEGEQQLAHFTQQAPDLTFTPFQVDTHGIALSWVHSAGYVRTLPGFHMNDLGTSVDQDGFFIAQFIKT